MNKPIAAIVLIFRFALAVVTSGVQTVQVILRNGLIGRAPPRAAFVRIRFAPMSARGAALLGCMVSLTPGTTVVDIDMPAREMVLHMLDASDAEAALFGIRRDFEPGLLTLFGRPR